MEKCILKCVKNQGTPNSLKKETKVGGLALPNFRIYYKSIVVIKTAWYKDRHTDQWNGIGTRVHV